MYFLNSAPMIHYVYYVKFKLLYLYQLYVQFKKKNTWVFLLHVVSLIPHTAAILWTEVFRVHAKSS